MAWVRSVKTKKALLKRIKVTGTGKLMKRPPGQNHFNAKEAGDSARQKKGNKLAPKNLIRDAKALLPSNI
jgi:ribosomal protein L35